MPVWNYHINLKDVFRSYQEGNSGFTVTRDEIVGRIRASDFWDEDDWELYEIVEELEESNNIQEFDATWNAFYDYADSNRIWVETF